MSAKAGLVHTEDSRPRPEGYGVALKDHFTGAQKRRPASALQAYRENFPFELDPEPNSMRQHMTDHTLVARA